MSKVLKGLMFDEYAARLEGRDSMLFVDGARIAAEDTRELRNRLREQNLRMIVVRNRILDKVLEKQGITGFRDIADGQVAVLVDTAGEDGGAQRAAKIIDKWFKEKKSAEVVGGVMEGQVADADEAKKWKDLPTREEMLSILVGQILGFGSKLAGQITGPAGELASQIEQRAEGKGNPAPADG